MRRAHSGLASLALVGMFAGCASTGLLPKPKPSCGGDEPPILTVWRCSETQLMLGLGYDAGIDLHPVPLELNPYASLSLEERDAISVMARSRQLRKDLEPFRARELRPDPCEIGGEIVLDLDSGEYSLSNANSSDLPKSVRDLLQALDGLSVKYFRQSIVSETAMHPLEQE